MTIDFTDALGIAGDAAGTLSQVLDVYGRISKFAKDRKIPEEARAELLKLSLLLSDANVKLSELQTALGRLQRAQGEMDAIEARKRNYVLSKTDAGTLIYRLKEDAETGEPPHEACPACFNQGKIAILQPFNRNLACNICKAVYATAPITTPKIVSDRFD